VILEDQLEEALRVNERLRDASSVSGGGATRD
ncbi:MAG: MerR family transcriptional regulator, partial [Streptomyces albidoflavus]